MPRNASTEERTGIIRRLLKSSRLRAEMFIEVWHNGEWLFLQDLDSRQGISIRKSAKRYRYANYNLAPVASSVSFALINENGKYSEGSGEDESGIIDINSKIRVSGGYELPDSEALNTITVDLAGDPITSVYSYMMSQDAGTLVLDNTVTNVESYFPSLFDTFYDSVNYDSGTYTPAAYSIITIDLIGNQFSTNKSFTIYSNTTRGALFWRVVDVVEGDIDTWTTAGNTAVGAKKVSVTGSARYLQVAVIYDGVAWGDPDAVLQLDVYPGNFELMYRDVFLLDTPEFDEPSAPGIPRVICSGRDSFKNAIETELSLKDYSAGEYIDGIIKQICDDIGIRYTADSIADLTAFGQRVIRVAYENSVTAEKVFEDLMQILNKAGNKYQMYVQYESTIDDSCLYVQPAPDTIRADYVLNFQHYQSLSGKKKNHDKQLKRITCLSDKKDTTEEVELATQIVVTSPVTLSWTGAANYKRIVIGGPNQFYLTGATNESVTLASDDPSIGAQLTVYGSKWSGEAGSVQSGTSTHDNVLDDLSLRGKYEDGGTAIYQIDITSTSPDKYSVIRDGATTLTDQLCGSWKSIGDGLEVKFGASVGHNANDTWKFTASEVPPRIQGEWMQVMNSSDNIGQTTEIINPLFLSDAEAMEVAEGFIEKFGLPNNEARSITWPYVNFILQQNDMVLLWSRFIYLDNLYFITGIEHKWTQDSGTTSFSIDDSGLKFEDDGSIIYDRDAFSSSVTSLKYDGGFLYDMRFTPQGVASDVDPTDYITDIDL